MNQLSKTSNLKTILSSEKIWKDIPGLDGLYQASNDGGIQRMDRVTSDGRRLKQRDLKLSKCSNGYLFFSPRTSRSKKTMLVHRAVLSAFSGSFQDLDVNHINGIKSDNRIDNLEWVTRSENLKHAARIGLKPSGENSHLSKLTREEVKEIRSLIGTMPQTEIAKKFGVAQTTISKINTGKKWKNQ